MALLDRWLGTSANPERRSSGLAALGGLGGMVTLGGDQSSAGVSVSEEGALRHTAVLASVRLLANASAMLPLPVYRRVKRGKLKVYDHPLYPVLQDQSNPEMTALELRRWLMQWVTLWGDGFAEIEWTTDGRLKALWPLRSDQMTVMRRNGVLLYPYTLASGQTVVLPAHRVLHLRGLTGDGLRGYSVIRELMRDSVGHGLALQEFGNRYFSNGARPGVVLKHPGILGDAAFANLMSTWASAHEGLSNAHRVRILEEGMDISTIGVPPNEAQFLESRQFSVTEIARAFGVPPHLIGDLSRSTFSNIEHQAIEFGQYSLYPWLRQIEQVINARCFTEEERRYLFVEHETNALVKTDILTRFQAYQIALQNGWLMRNEVRSLENLNPVKGGDSFLIPVNMAIVDPNAPPPAPAPAQSAPDEAQRLLPVFADAAQRVARREAADRKRGRAGFEDELADFALEVFAPLAQALGLELGSGQRASVRALFDGEADAAQRTSALTEQMFGWALAQLETGVEREEEPWNGD